MRLGVGDHLRLFNGREGEWQARLEVLDRRRARAMPVEPLRAQSPGPDLWLLFAPLKSAQTDIVIVKATELGVSALRPVTTRFSQTHRLNLERAGANAVEAAEQCGRLDIPAVMPPSSLETLLDSWPDGRPLIACDPRFETPIAEAVRAVPPGPTAVLVGPEGGFAPGECESLEACPTAVPVNLGPRILRAETAAIAALTCWQALRGDWAAGPR